MNYKYELIPVLEIGYHQQPMRYPKNLDGTDDTNEWKEYRKKGLNLYGCPDDICEYFPGTLFFRLNQLPPTTIKWILQKELSDYLEQKHEFDELSPLFGGYALVKEGRCLLYPQCCGDLSDIIFWKNICILHKNSYYNGHPEPYPVFDDLNVYFDCKDEYEPFYPSGDDNFVVTKKELESAYYNVLTELKFFYEKVVEICKNMEIPVEAEKIANSLIYYNCELDDDTV